MLTCHGDRAGLPTLPTQRRDAARGAGDATRGVGAEEDARIRRRSARGVPTLSNSAGAIIGCCTKSGSASKRRRTAACSSVGPTVPKCPSARHRSATRATATPSGQCRRCRCRFAAASGWTTRHRSNGDVDQSRPCTVGSKRRGASGRTTDIADGPVWLLSLIVLFLHDPAEPP